MRTQDADRIKKEAVRKEPGSLFAKCGKCDSIGGMRRKRTNPVFKPYVMNQVALMPPSYDEKIPADHLVRLVNEA
ncbi:MAG: hypothetical protein ABSA01_12065, partial [Anaerolineales bacterium]